MRWLLFISRVTLLCNLCFALTLIIRYSHDFIRNQTVSNYVITLGYSSFVINFFLTVLLLVTLFRKKDSSIPIWLTITNLLFFIVQIFAFII